MSQQNINHGDGEDGDGTQKVFVELAAGGALFGMGESKELKMT